MALDLGIKCGGSYSAEEVWAFSAKTMMDTHTTERFKWSPRVASRTLEETAFILNQSQMVSLNPVGTFVWDQLKGSSKSLEELTGAVTTEFEVEAATATQDIEQFLRELIQESLVVVENDEASAE